MEPQDCVISGGGPAGIMLALILARAGINVTVLEKHDDFLRDFRGDTVHPATIRLLDELGLGDKFRELPQSRLGNVALPDGRGNTVLLGDFASLSAPYNYVAMVPQWDLLNLLVEAAKQEPTFTLLLNTKATWLTMDNGTVTGVTYQNSDGEAGQISAQLTVACDGRHSTTRAAAGLQPFEFPVSFDTWWFRLSRKAAEQGQVGMLVPRPSRQGLALSLARPTYYQIAFFDAKGANSRLRRDGIEAFKARIAQLMPEYADRLDEITNFDDLHHLDVKLNRLKRWYRPGFIAIGDAAHAMSPAGGVGINLAIQDAVAAAAKLAPALKKRNCPDIGISSDSTSSLAPRRRHSVDTAHAASLCIHASSYRNIYRDSTASPLGRKKSAPPFAKSCLDWSALVLPLSTPQNSLVAPQRLARRPSRLNRQT